LIRHDGALKSVNQLSDGYLIGQNIDISRVYPQPMQGERGAPAHGPLPVPDGRDSLNRPTPCRNWAMHDATLGSAPYSTDPAPAAYIGGCHCDRCRAANAGYMIQWRAGRRGNPSHKLGPFLIASAVRQTDPGGT
jgi:hypothetical protein